MPLVRIAFSGKAGSGKSSAIEVINKISSKENVRNIKFADDLYRIMYMVQDYLGLDNHKDGKFLQVVGTEWGRNKDKNIWVNKFQESLNKVINEKYEKDLVSSVIVCDDVRMGNEFDCVKRNKFFTVRIKRELSQRTGSLAGRDLNHQSEIEMNEIPDDCFDMIIDNNGSLEDFQKQIERAFWRASAKSDFTSTINKLVERLDKELI
jgi:dephospho-CoA kinase